MGQAKKRNYDRYTLDFKRQAVKLANHPNIIAKDIAESLGIHVVMLYRWRMELQSGVLFSGLKLTEGLNNDQPVGWGEEGTPKNIK